MDYFFCDIEIDGQDARLSDAEQLHHMRDVLRLKAGEQVAVCDNTGKVFVCTISKLDKQTASLKIESRLPAPPPRARLTIACAVPKQSGMDEIVDKLTQTGVDEIIPLKTGRTIVRMNEGAETRLERWRKISRRAAEQSRRRRLPLIAPVMDLAEVLKKSGEYGLKLIPTLEGERKSLKEITAGLTAGTAIALIGPEGDFTPEEVAQAQKAGFTAISLGETVLRVETAAVVVAGYLRIMLI